jgi:hypothetical protein
MCRLFSGRVISCVVPDDDFADLCAGVRRSDEMTCSKLEDKTNRHDWYEMDRKELTPVEQFSC